MGWPTVEIFAIYKIDVWGNVMQEYRNKLTVGAVVASLFAIVAVTVFTAFIRPG